MRRNQGTLLRLLIEYFNTSEKGINIEMQHNAEQGLTNLSEEVYQLINNLNDTDKDKTLKSGMSKIQRVLNELDKELDKKEPNIFNMIERLNTLKKSIDKSFTISKETKKNFLQVLKIIQNSSFDVFGFSNANIHRMTVSNKVNRDKILKLYKFWFEPLIVSDQYKDFNKDFISYILFQYKNENEDFSDVLVKLESFFEEQDSKISEAHFCELFDIFKDTGSIEEYIYDKEKTLDFIHIELEKIMSKQEANTRGISDNERSFFFSQIIEQLVEDSTVYHLNINSLPDNFKALIRYRLGHLLYRHTGGNNYKALAFYISQKDFPGNVYIHPAAKIDAKVYISEQVIIGSNCRICQYCYIGKNVCIIPFYMEQTNLLNDDIVLEAGVIVDDLAKIIGRVRIGQNSYIKSQQFIFNDIPAKISYDKMNEIPLSEEEYQKYLTNMENNK